MVAEWEDDKGRILKASGLPGRWVDDSIRPMQQDDWQQLVNIKLLAAGTLKDKPGQKSTPAEFEQQDQKCIDRITARWATR